MPLQRSVCMALVSVAVMSSCAPLVESTSTPKLIWISLDGLKKADLERYAKSLKQPHKFGIKYLLAKKNWNDALQMTNPTITASSHVSTITCTPPGIHGVVANKQWNGKKFESGFGWKYKTESFPAALRDQGILTASVAFPGIDETHDARMPSFGMNYDSPSNKARYETMNLGETKTVKIPSRVKEKTEVDATITADSKGKTVTFAIGEDTAIGTLGQWANVRFVEEGKKQEVSFMFYALEDNVVKFYVGPTSMNSAYPEKFREKLDNENLVFSNAKDYGMADYSDEFYLSGLSHRLMHFAGVSRFVLHNEKPEAAFLYFEDLDTIAHQYAGDGSKNAAIAKHIEKLDAELGSIFEILPESTNVLVMGDHGMSEIQYEINMMQVLPSSTHAHFVTNNSGGAFFLYGKDRELNSEPPVSEAWFVEAVEALRNAQVEFDGNKKVFAKVVVRGSDEAKALGLNGPEMPWVMAFAEPGLSVRTSMEPVYLMARRKTFNMPESMRQKYPDPVRDGELVEPLLGAHGHWARHKDLRTSLVMFGPELEKVPAAEIQTNIEVVPAVADALSYKRPSGCEK